MTLQECLESQPQAHLREIAREVGLGATGAAQQTDLAARLAARLKNPEVLAGLVRLLSEPERAALKVITFAGGGSGIIMEQCHQRINQVTGRRRRNGAQVVASLMGRGLVFVGRARYRQYYFIPADLQIHLAAMFARELLGRVAMGPDAVVTAQEQDSYALLRWTCQFLSYIRKAPVELTQAGVIYRRAQRQLLRVTGQEVTGEFDEEGGEGSVYGGRGKEAGGSGLGEGGRGGNDSSRGGSDAGRGGAGSSRRPAGDAQGPGLPAHAEPLDLIFDYCRARRLCEIHDLALAAGPEAAAWMARPVWDRRQDYLAFWREARVSWDVDVQAVLSVLVSLPGDTWVDMEALFQELEPMASDLHRGSLRRRLEQKVLRQLVIQGLLQLGETPLTRVCRITGLGRALLGGGPPVEDVETERSFFVQPNFELLVPSRLDTDVLWRLEECADLVKADWMMVYTLSRATVYRALRLGRRQEEVVGLLERHARNELPQNVQFSVRDWSTAFGRLWFGSAFIVNCETPALADELLASRTLGGFFRGRLSPTVLVVNRDDHAALLARLEDEGYMPSPGVRVLGEATPDERRALFAATAKEVDNQARSRR